MRELEKYCVKKIDLETVEAKIKTQTLSSDLEFNTKCVDPWLETSSNTSTILARVLMISVHRVEIFAFTYLLDSAYEKNRPWRLSVEIMRAIRLTSTCIAVIRSSTSSTAVSCNSPSPQLQHYNQATTSVSYNRRRQRYEQHDWNKRDWEHTATIGAYPYQSRRL